MNNNKHTGEWVARIALVLAQGAGAAILTFFLYEQVIIP